MFCLSQSWRLWNIQNNLKEQLILEHVNVGNKEIKKITLEKPQTLLLS